MIKLFLSTFTIMLMPLKFLFIISIFFNVLSLLIINSFVTRDTYFESAEEFFLIKSKIEKAFERACDYSVKCSIKFYAKDSKNQLIETYSKTLNEIKQTKISNFIESIKAPIQKLLSENELKKFIKKQEPINNVCFNMNEETLICSGEEMLAVFKANDCVSCFEIFKKEFRVFEKKKYKNYVIKITHKIHNYLFQTANIKPINSADIIKEKIEDLTENE